MGQLIALSEFQRGRESPQTRPQRNPIWYFADAYWTRDHYAFNVASSYPVPMYVHSSMIAHDLYGEDEKKRAAENRIAVRRWIERSISGDVIFDHVNLSYYRVYGSSHSVSTIEHSYDKFNFENDGDAFAFRLRFDFVETATQPRNPKYGPEDPPSCYDFDKRHHADDFVSKLRYGPK